ncbi:MAG: hypothetical protein R3266_14395 [Gemmatimonadota bacterium]|nr:hypothetical protein [Gemmatimonadota bacterium]
MSIISFHRFLISTAILFCAGFAGWEFRRWAADGGPAALVLGIIFGILAAGLAYYLIHLARFLGREESR